MVLRHPLFNPDVAENRFLPLVVTTHIYFLNHNPVETTCLPQFPRLFSASCEVVPQVP
jgi:hypothetical protein